ncbi:hypothetical protein BRD03_02440 [Halobacteriales archaeon QS_9_68_17]|nr:MAG: hypothetical protein BRD03_02440 [Halobacteriales archaeon QS_9_68_17]
MTEGDRQREGRDQRGVGEQVRVRRRLDDGVRRGEREDGTEGVVRGRVSVGERDEGSDGD